MLLRYHCPFYLYIYNKFFSFPYRYVTTVLLLYIYNKFFSFTLFYISRALRALLLLFSYIYSIFYTKLSSGGARRARVSGMRPAGV